MRQNSNIEDERTGGEPEARRRFTSHAEYRAKQAGGPVIGHDGEPVEKAEGPDAEGIAKSIEAAANPYADGHEALTDVEERDVLKKAREGESRGLDPERVRTELEKAGLRPRGGVSKSAPEGAETGGAGGGSPTDAPEDGQAEAGPEGGEAALIALAADRVIKDLRAAVEDGATDEEWAAIGERLDRLNERAEALEEVTPAEAEALQKRAGTLVELAERADRAQEVPA